VRRGFLNIYPFAVRKSTEDSFRVADEHAPQSNVSPYFVRPF
jgi:hypothetical protein